MENDHFQRQFSILSAIFNGKLQKKLAFVFQIVIRSKHAIPTTILIFRDVSDRIHHFKYKMHHLNIRVHHFKSKSIIFNTKGSFLTERL